MLTLNNLSSPRGANRNTKRLGRGQGSGQGTQAGKGHKGQKARKSGHVRSGFESGAMPLYIMLPKKGFKNHAFKKVYSVINLGELEKKFNGDEVTRESLIETGLLKGIEKRRPIKILGKGELTKSFKFKGIEKFSTSAMELIKKAGGSIE
jgi:large subunit ribosomal protein L15